MMASSSSSATVAVEKATSDLLMGPDWTMNIEICDSINSNHWQPKDVVKAVKKRLQHRSSRVQLLALTLLETMVKNCGDYVHFQIAERNLLEEMIKIVRKKADMQVRDKILVLLDSWQEAFGGPGGKYPQYFWAYEELRRTGVVFPKRSPDAAPIFTPPPTHPNLRNMQAGYGMPSTSSKTLDETMATEIESLSLSSLESMQHVLDLLSDMLQAVNPSDRAAVKDEVIIDLVDRCRTNQKKLMQMLTTTGDEELLGRGLELNDSIQSLLARHDAIASGTSFPIQGASSSTVSTEVHSSVDQSDVKSSSPVESASTPKASSSAIVFTENRSQSDEEEEDEFAQLARRHSKAQPVTSKDATTGSSENSGSTPNVPDPSTSVPSNALVLSDPPAPVSAAKDQDIIDLLSITLSMSPSSQTTYEPPPKTTYEPSPQTTYEPSGSSQGIHQRPVPSGTEGYSYASQTYPGNLPYNSYVVPWAQTQALQQQPQHHQYSPPQQHLQPPNEPQPLQYQPQHQPPQSQPQLQLQYQHQPAHAQQPQSQPNQHVQYPSRYPPPPWAATPGYANYQNHSTATNAISSPQGSTTASYTSAPGVRPSGVRNPTSATGQRPFVPSYRLFEDLNVFGNTDGRVKMTSSGTSSSLSGSMGPGMVGGRK
uniref:TOM1-like protein 2 n=1 Tax=Cajanus cajan TaxID=3821 RepID=A0A151R7Q6_CAJCA|nr:TOM1-like protein 2 [Cajanus cajan]